VGFRVHVKGEVKETQSNMQRMNRVLRLLEESGKPCKPRDIAAALKLREDEVLRYLRYMEKTREVTQPRPGHYLYGGGKQ